MKIEEINKKLADKKRIITDIYFELQEMFEKKYGENVLIFLELGSFFEIYSVDNEKMKMGKAKEVAELLNIQLTRKNKSIAENSIKNPFMAGVPTVAFERHLNRLIQEKKYTIVLIRQKGEPPKVTRYLEKVISPGTNFDYLSGSGESFLVALTIDVHQNCYSIGYSAIDVSTGVTYVTEINSTPEDSNYALDEVFNLLQVYKTSEVVLNFLNRFVNQHKVLEYLEIQKNHPFAVQTRRIKIDFQNELFKRIYNTNSFLSPIEELNLEHFPLASESLAILIEFIFQHDYKIAEKLNRPTILENSNYLYLGNSAVEQLDIISENSTSSVLNLIDKTSTAMGKRILKSRLLNPVTEKGIINERLDLVERVFPKVSEIDENLKKIYDLERIVRRVKLKKLNPLEINYLHTSLIATENLSEIIRKNLIDTFPFTKLEVREIIDKLETIFDLNITHKYTIQQIDENIFLKGVNLEIDNIEREINRLFGSLNLIVEKVSELLKQKVNKSDIEMVTLGNTDKEGFYISLTKNRFNLIQKEFENEKIFIKDKEYFFRDFKIRKLSNSVKITSEIIDTISEQIAYLKSRLVTLVKETFLNELEEIELKYSLILERVSQFISKIDVATSSAKVARDYNYVKPEIVDVEKGEQFLQIGELRHLLIERREVNGIYVPNDIFMGEKKYFKEEFGKKIADATEEKRVDGMLLYGINSSGKSSLMKSVGIAIILAQAGFYVPAKMMRFSIFNSLFTRIVSKDNLEKGLSSFAVEMMELKNIFNRTVGRTIVLGDEISHGTETLSGVAIVSSAIIRLVEKRAMFIFATHLHQLIRIDEVQNLGTVVNLHLAVKYDEKEDKLIFNRKLEIGSGSSIYGLEFAKSLHMDSKFLKKANLIRKRISEEYSDVELLLQNRKSRYNKNLYLTKCIICGEKVDDVHHIVGKKKASPTGFIGHFSKNHKHNLIPLCKKHHSEIHEGKISIQGFLTTSKGLELHYEVEGGE